MSRTPPTITRARSGDSTQRRLAEAIGDLPLDRVAERAHVHRSTIRRVLQGTGKRGAYTGTVEAIEQAAKAMRGPQGAQ